MGVFPFEDNSHELRVAFLLETQDFVRFASIFYRGDPMQTLVHMPVFFAAAQYALLYMLFGGGLVGAAGVYVVAKALRK